MINQNQLHRIYRASAIYDLVLSAPFAVAPGVWAVWAAMNTLSALAGLPALAPLDSHGMMFANFFGTIVTLWSVLRLYLDRTELARWDAVGRLSFSLAMAVALANGASPLLWPVLVIEMLWAVLQLLPLRSAA